MLFAPFVKLFAHSVELLEVLQTDLDVLRVDSEVAQEALGPVVLPVLVQVRGAEVVVLRGRGARMVGDWLGEQDAHLEGDLV